MPSTGQALNLALGNIRHQLFRAMMANKPLTIQRLLNNQAGRVLQSVDDKQNHLFLTETHLRLHTRI
jgi:hypothetical protein